MTEQLSSQQTFRIQRDKVARYFYWVHIALILSVGVWFFGLGILIALVYALTVGEWLPHKQANALRYWLDGSTLRVEEGVYTLKRKAIPLDRITDLVLYQPFFIRPFDIWILTVQTSGMGMGAPEAVLFGLNNPEAIRDQILQARDAYLRRPTLS